MLAADWWWIYHIHHQKPRKEKLGFGHSDRIVWALDFCCCGWGVTVRARVPAVAAARAQAWVFYWISYVINSWSISFLPFSLETLYTPPRLKWLNDDRRNTQWLDGFAVIQHFRAVFWARGFLLHLDRTAWNRSVSWFISSSVLIPGGLPGSSLPWASPHREVFILSSQLDISYHLTCNLLKYKEAAFLASWFLCKNGIFSSLAFDTTPYAFSRIS